MNDIFSRRTQKLINFDLLRHNARLKTGKKKFNVNTDKLHLGCQSKKIDGWLNVDVIASDLDVDLGGGYLPFHDGIFRSIVCQQTIEHLNIEDELIPLFREMKRVCSPGAEIWLSCPDISKICAGYLSDKGLELLKGKQHRYKYEHGDAPAQQVINAHFYQDGEHQNLFDLELLQWVLMQAQLENIEKVTEENFLKRFPGFPRANDEDHSLYVKIIV